MSRSTAGLPRVVADSIRKLSDGHDTMDRFAHILIDLFPKLLRMAFPFAWAHRYRGATWTTGPDCGAQLLCGRDNFKCVLGDATVTINEDQSCTFCIPGIVTLDPCTRQQIRFGECGVVSVGRPAYNAARNQSTVTLTAPTTPMRLLEEARTRKEIRLFTRTTHFYERQARGCSKDKRTSLALGDLCRLDFSALLWVFLSSGHDGIPADTQEGTAYSQCKGLLHDMCAEFSLKAKLDFIRREWRNIRFGHVAAWKMSCSELKRAVCDLREALQEFDKVAHTHGWWEPGSAQELVEQFDTEVSRLLDVQVSDSHRQRFMQAMGRRLIHIPFPPNPHFTGRDTLSRQLRSTFFPNEPCSMPETFTFVCLSGVGGVGKTSLLQHYAQECINDNLYTGGVLLLNAESLDTLVTDLRNFVNCLAMDDHQRMQWMHDIDLKCDLKERVRQAWGYVRDWLLESSQRPFLLGLDNADDVDTLTRSVVWENLQSMRNSRPAGQSIKGHVLITSRSAEWRHHTTCVIEVGKASLSDSRRILTRVRWSLDNDVDTDTERSKLSSEDSDALEEILHELDGLPLALDQVGHFMHRMDIGFARFLELFREENLRLFEHRYAQPSMRQDAANNDDVGDVLSLLTRAGIQRGKADEYAQRLKQQHVRSSTRLMELHVVERVLTLWRAIGDERKVQQVFDACEQCVPKLRSVRTTWSMNVQALSPDARTLFDALCLTASDHIPTGEFLQHIISGTCNSMSEHDNGGRDSNVICAENSVAELLENSLVKRCYDNTTYAIACQSNVELSIHRLVQRFGRSELARHPDKLQTSLSAVAGALKMSLKECQHGRVATNHQKLSIIVAHAKCVSRRDADCGKMSHAVGDRLVDMYMNAAEVLSYEGRRYDDAMFLYEAALKLGERMYGHGIDETEPHHWHNAEALDGIGHILLRKTQYEPATKSCRKALHMQRAIYRKSPSPQMSAAIAKTLRHLGDVQKYKHQLVKARSLYIQAQSALQSSDANHTRILKEQTAIYNQLGALDARDNNFERARQHHAAAVECVCKWRKMQPSKASQANKALAIATAYQGEAALLQGRVLTNADEQMEYFKETISLCEQSLKTTKAIHATGHWLFSWNLTLLGQALMMLDDLPAAQRRFEEALEQDRTVYGRGPKDKTVKHKFIAEKLHFLAEVQHRQGAHHEACSLMRNALDMQIACNPDDRNIAKFKIRLNEMLAKTGGPVTPM